MKIRISLPSLLLVSIILITVFLRLFRINENLVFNGELGDNYLAIRSTIGNGIFPLLGPPTSHPWLSFGPLFYYVLAPFLILNKWNPNTGAYFFGVISVIAVILNYFLVKKYFGIKTALISCYLIAISTAWINVARQARFFSMVVYLFYPFFLLIEERKHFFLLGLVFGVMLNFHLAPIFLIPVLLILIWRKRREVTKKQMFLLIVGFLVSNIPFVIYNFKTHFEMITKFVVWIPYRSVIYHNFNLAFTMQEIYNFFGGLLLLPVVLSIYLERRNRVVQTLVLFLFFGILALIFHKDPPEHYFYVLYAIPIILISILINKLNNFLVCSILILTTVMNFSFLFSDKWFYIDETKVVQNTNVPYNLQQIAANKIISDAKGKPFNLKRIGYSDQFDDYYEQNYDYLLWLNGNKPKKYSTNLIYTIVEYPNMKITKEIK